jgi:hypothetical protein
MKEKFLLTVLAFEFPLHSQSAFNPSIFTVKKFKENEKDKKNLLTGLYITLFLNLIFSIAVSFYDKTIGLIAFIVSISIFVYYYKLIEQ